ncbi:MAG: VOC family protein [Gammaproteobacteria bacterium]
MRLAKPHLDIGLFTNDIATQRRFWGETCGLRLDHELPLGIEGIVQSRYDAHDSVIKVNDCPNPLPALPRSGYVGLTIARAGQPAWAGTHPGGDAVRLVPPGTDGVVGIGVTVSTPDPARMMTFYVEALEFEPVSEDVARCGDSLLFVERGPGATPTERFIGPDFRYLTFQIYDCDAACAQVAARGGRIAAAPVTLGEVARYAFVVDPDGNWIEISERFSLTGYVRPATD